MFPIFTRSLISSCYNMKLSTFCKRRYFFSEINSIKDPAFKLLRDSRTESGRKITNSFVIEGFDMIKQALSCSYSVKNIFFSDLNENEASFLLNYKDRDVKLFKINKGMMKKVFSGGELPYIIATAEPPKYSFDDFHLYRSVVLMDNVQNPNNIGMIIRSCEALGCQGLIANGETCNQIFTRKSLHSSKGSIFRLPILFSDTLSTIKFCKKHGFKVITTTPYASLDLNQITQSFEKAIVILGNETNGVQNIWVENSDFNVKIKMHGDIESLNVSVCSGIVINYFFNKNE